ncbi:hypothetical protein WOLCODRAFT_18049 [Wolfiporia cocos MD-104 SS10]|uniref:Uncharacterized protein n=1 Tax=Wolfiporia cocos (strain MD-104) TaxID=742152 RepID=A0A2H3JM51_WOLCO|nr:hypothetical protein WOLCODRAFT_18049 [Wolfiporia cocos MD-104 SS10]
MTMTARIPINNNSRRRRQGPWATKALICTCDVARAGPPGLHASAGALAGTRRITYILGSRAPYSHGHNHPGSSAPHGAGLGRLLRPKGVRAPHRMTARVCTPVAGRRAPRRSRRRRRALRAQVVRTCLVARALAGACGWRRTCAHAQADLTGEESVIEMYNHTSTEFGPVQVLMVPVAHMSLEQWNMTMNTNLTSSFLVASKYLRRLKEASDSAKSKADDVWPYTIPEEQYSDALIALRPRLRNSIIEKRMIDNGKGPTRTSMLSHVVGDRERMYRMLATYMHLRT